jgi:hypothetical protein
MRKTRYTIQSGFAKPKDAFDQIRILEGVAKENKLKDVAGNFFYVESGSKKEPLIEISLHTVNKQSADFLLNYTKQTQTC